MRAIEWVFALGAVVLVLLVVYGAANDAQQFEKFRQEHNCKLIESHQSESSIGWVAGDVAVMTKPGQKVWLCDDGVKYYR